MRIQIYKRQILAPDKLPKKATTKVMGKEKEGRHPLFIIFPKTPNKMTTSTLILINGYKRTLEVHKTLHI